MTWTDCSHLSILVDGSDLGIGRIEGQTAGLVELQITAIGEDARNEKPVFLADGFQEDAYSCDHSLLGKSGLSTSTPMTASPAASCPAEAAQT
jgi:hypothetical protein